MLTLFRGFVLGIALSLYLSPVFGAEITHKVIEEPTPQTVEDVDYGEMYVIQKHETTENLWQTKLAYSYGFSNPYLSIHGVQLSVSHQLAEFLSIGISPNFYTTTNKAIATNLQSQLGAQGIETQVYQPKHATYVLMGFSPFSGMLNWFNVSTVNFDFIIGAGAGYAKYAQQSGVMPSFRLFATPEMMLGKSFGLTAGIQITYDRFSDGDWQNRIDALFGALARF